MGNRLRARHGALFIPLVLGMVLLGAFSAAADHVTPTFRSGNPSCPAGFNELKVEPVADGSYSDIDETPGPLTVTLTVDETAKEIDWTSNIGVDVVIVKGGPNANIYTYNPESTGDSNLHAPENDNNNGWYGLSHVSFCYEVENTSSPSPSVSPSETETPGTSPSPSVSPSETETPGTSPSPSVTPTETETPGTSPSPSVTPTETETPGTTVSPGATTSPRVLGNKVLGNTGAAVRNLIYLALALAAMGLLAYTVARRSAKSE